MQILTQRLLLASWLASAIGCFDNRPTCVPEVKPGDVFTVTLHERWDSTSMSMASHPAMVAGFPLSPCGLSDLAPGMTFTARLRGDELKLNECVLPSCSDDFPSDSEPLEGDRPLIGGGSGRMCMNHHRKVRLSEDCEAARVVELLRYDSTNTDIEDLPRPGQRPHVVLLRRLDFVVGRNSAQCTDPASHFSPTSQLSATSWSCADVFAVSLHKE